MFWLVVMCVLFPGGISEVASNRHQNVGRVVPNYEPTVTYNKIAAESSPVLPILDRDDLSVALRRASSEDLKLGLRHKLVAIAWLPHLTLYAAASPAALDFAKKQGLKVVATIKPVDYRHAVRAVLSKRLLQKSTFGLARKMPKFSASRRLTDQQTFSGVALLVMVVFAFAFLPNQLSFMLASFVLGLFFLSVVALRVLCFLPHMKLNGKQLQQVPKLASQDLPIYSVLVPVFREIPVLDQLLTALQALDYPVEKLDIKLILEESDTAMVQTVSTRKLPAHIDVIVVPSGKPQTKPRALNYALQFAKGSLLTIFDAEDVPEPRQLRQAAEVFAQSPPTLACLQARLVFFNPNENWLTRQFTIEYGTLFSLVVPTLASDGLPIPLGGTSNHFRTDILRQIGAWDPFNMTEDCDLGIRLARAGYITGVVDSQTYEEANSKLGNWLHQRARWLKGFMQSWLVHMREPRRLLKELGVAGFWVMQVSTIGLLVSALFHPFLVAYTVWMLVTVDAAALAGNFWVSVLTGINIVVFFGGYGLTIFAGRIALRKMAIAGWWGSLLTMPVYWCLMSVAAWIALWQLIWNPFYWNKTTHGLSAHQQAAAALSPALNEAI